MKRKKKRKAEPQRGPSVVAFSARRALSDARLAHQDFEKALAEGYARRVRAYWLMCITLLRAVGHVLAKVDAERSSYLAKASHECFQRCKDNRFANLVFWEFIEAERNMLLKEYTSSIFDVEYDPEGNAPSITLVDIMIGPDVYTPSAAIRSAIEWWVRYLEAVESLARGYRQRENSDATNTSSSLTPR